MRTWSGHCSPAMRKSANIVAEQCERRSLSRLRSQDNTGCARSLHSPHRKHWSTHIYICCMALMPLYYARALFATSLFDPRFDSPCRLRHFSTLTVPRHRKNVNVQVECACLMIPRYWFGFTVLATHHPPDDKRSISSLPSLRLQVGLQISFGGR